MKSNVRLIIAVVIAITSTVLTLALLFETSKHFNVVSDLPEYVVAGHLILEGRAADLYNWDAVIEGRKRLFPGLRDRPGVSVLSPPPAFPLFAPIGLLPVEVIKLIWQPILVLASCAAIALLSRTYKLTLRQAVWLWTVLFMMGPFFESLKLGQISSFLLLTLVGAIALFKRQKDFAAGALLSIFVLKPQELVTLVLFLFGAKRYSAIKGFATAMAALGTISLLMSGLHVYEQFFERAKHLSALNYIMRPELSPTIRGQLLRLPFLNESIVHIAALIILVSACAFSFWWGRRQAKSAFWLESGVSVALPLGLATAMLVHFYDLVLLIPAIICLLKTPVVGRVSKVFEPLGMLTLLVFSWPVYLYVHYNWVVGSVALNPYAAIMIGYSCVLIYFALAGKFDET